MTIARSGQMAEGDFKCPSGESVRLVDAGTTDVTGIGITLSSPAPRRLLDFDQVALECEHIGPSTLRCGDSLLRFVEGKGGCEVDDFAAPGFRYITVQVFDADQEMARIVGHGSRIVRPAQNFKGVARYGFVSDADGNWIEISARTSLSGIAVR